MPQLENPPFSIPYDRQRTCVIIISFGFLSIFTAYAPLEAVISKLYMNFGHENLGPLSLGILYLTYAFSSIIGSSAVNLLGYKKTLILSSLAYTSFETSGLVLYYFGEYDFISYMAAVFPAMFTGLFAGFLWVAQAGYIGHISQIQYREEMFGIFVAFRGIATLVGYFLNLYLLTEFRQDTYFKTLIPVGGKHSITKQLVFFFSIGFLIQNRYKPNIQKNLNQLRQSINLKTV